MDPNKSRTNKTGVVSGGKTIKRITMTKRANLTFPVAQVMAKLHEGQYARQASPAAAVYLAAVLEYVVQDMFDLCAEEAEAAKKTSVTPRVFNLAVRKDEAMAQLMKGVIVGEGGVVPHVEPEILKGILETGDEVAKKTNED